MDEGRHTSRTKAVVCDTHGADRAVACPVCDFARIQDLEDQLEQAHATIRGLLATNEYVRRNIGGTYW